MNQDQSESRIAVRDAYLALDNDFMTRYRGAWCSADQESRRATGALWVGDLLKHSITPEQIRCAHQAVISDDRYQSYPPRIGQFIALCKAQHDDPTTTDAASESVLRLHKAMLARFRGLWCGYGELAEAEQLHSVTVAIQQEQFRDDIVVDTLDWILNSGGYVHSPPSVPDIVELCHGNRCLDPTLVGRLVAGDRIQLQLTEQEIVALKFARSMVGSFDGRMKTDPGIRRSIYKYFREGLVKARRGELSPPPEETHSSSAISANPANAEYIALAIDGILGSIQG